jgi:hypothetical protein
MSDAPSGNVPSNETYQGKLKEVGSCFSFVCDFPLMNITDITVTLQSVSVKYAIFLARFRPVCRCRLCRTSRECLQSVHIPFVITNSSRLRNTTRQSFPVTSHGDSDSERGVGMECWASFLTVTFGTTRRQSRQLYAPAGRTLLQGNSLVLTSVTACVDPTGERKRDLPSCVALPKPTAAPLAPLRTSSPHKYAFTVCGRTVSAYYLVLKLYNT